MNKTHRIQSKPYEAMRSFLASETGRAGRERLEALGASWGSTVDPFQVAPRLATLRGAPPLPDLHTYGNSAAFMAGVCWCMAFLSNRSHMEADS